MNVFFVVGKSTYTENFYLRVWEAQSDGVSGWVYQTILVEKNSSGVPTPGAGHQVTETVSVTGLDTVTHIVRLIGVTSGTIWAEYTHQPTEKLVNVFVPVRFKIGDGGTNTPTVNQDVCTTPELIGLTTDDFIIHRKGLGPLKPVQDYSFTSGTGVWALQNGDIFGIDEEFTIDLNPQVVSNPVSDSVVGKWFGGFVDVGTNTNYSSTHLRKLIRFAGQCTYTFLLTDVIPVGYVFAFTNLGTSSGTGICTVQFLNGVLKWGNTTKTTLDLPGKTEAAFVFDGTQWNVIYIADSRFVDGAAIAPGTILGTGSVSIGDVPAGDPSYTVIHNLNITGDYNVWLQVKSNVGATAFRDNKICSTFWHDTTGSIKKDRFYFSIQEISGEVQNVSIVWTIIKA